VLFLAGGSVLGQEPETVAPTATGGGRLYYLTVLNTYHGNDAPTACAAGYHMASLWEIVDPSSLTYAWDHPSAYTLADSGRGAPTAGGWIRTGTPSSGTGTPGIGNCLAWTTDSNASYGTAAYLPNNWGIAVQITAPYYPDTTFCSIPSRVWCVSD
jgi:hypothetical protein